MSQTEYNFYCILVIKFYNIMFNSYNVVWLLVRSKKYSTNTIDFNLEKKLCFNTAFRQAV